MMLRSNCASSSIGQRINPPARTKHVFVWPTTYSTHRASSKAKHASWLNAGHSYSSGRGRQPTVSFSDSSLAGRLAAFSFSARLRNAGLVFEDTRSGGLGRLTWKVVADVLPISPKEQPLTQTAMTQVASKMSSVDLAFASSDSRKKEIAELQVSVGCT